MESRENDPNEIENMAEISTDEFWEKVRQLATVRKISPEIYTKTRNDIEAWSRGADNENQQKSVYKDWSNVELGQLLDAIDGDALERDEMNKESK